MRITTCTDLLLNMILGIGWLDPDINSDLEQDIKNIEQLKCLVDDDNVSIYLHPSLRNFVKIPIERRFPSRYRVRQEMRNLERYATLDESISLNQSCEEFEDLECPDYAKFDEGLILVSAKMIDADAIVCTEETKFVLNQIIELNPEYFTNFGIKIFNLQEFLDDVSQDIQQIPNVKNGRESVFVRTPMNCIVELPRGSTTLDFACAVHTKIATCYAGTLVNGNKVSPDYILENGDVVQILRGEFNNIFREINLSPDFYSEIEEYLRRFCFKKSTIKFLKRVFEKDYRNKGWKIINDNLNRNQRRMLEEPEFYNSMESSHSIRYRKELVLYLGLAKIHIDELKEVLKNLNVDNVKPNFFVSQHQDFALAKTITLSTCCNPSLSDNILGIISSTKKTVRVHSKKCHYTEEEVNRKKLVELEWNCLLLGVSLQITLYNQPRALSELINFLDQAYCDQYNIHSVTPIPEHRVSQVLIHLILNKYHNLSKLLNDVENLDKLVRCRVKDSYPLTENTKEKFFRIT